MLAAADRIVHGQLPWRDFWWNYGPAEPFLLAGLQELFGRSLLVWRIVHVLVAALSALLAYRLVRREAPVPLALVAWLTVAAALSYPLIPNPVGSALLLALAGIAIAPRRPALAGVCAGLALAFRLDVGAAAVLAVVLACWRPRSPASGLVANPRSGASTRATGLRALLVAAATALLVYLPLAIVVGGGRLLDQTVGFALSEQSLQRLPLPFDGGGTDDLNKAFEHLFPTFLLAGFALWIVVACLRWARGAGPPRGLALAALPLALAGALYVLARADEFHVVLLASSLPLLAASLLATELDEPRVGWLAVGATALVLALPLAYGLDRKGVQLLHPPQLATIHVDAADGVRTQPAEARALAALVRRVRMLTKPGEPVFVANPRHDLVRAGNPLVSVLIDRPNPTRYPIMQPGVVTTRGVQEQIVRELRDADTRLVVRWRSPVADEREPNGAGRSNGVRVLDRYLADHYYSAKRLGDYELLLATSAPGSARKQQRCPDRPQRAGC